MSLFLGIDTSNYTTSAALADENGIVKSERMLLAVKEGERGLRQSDAVFSHTVNLPQIMAGIGKCTPDAIGVSVTPRDCEGSYMPCFLAGKAAAVTLAQVMGVPMYTFSHQMGHLAAALYSCGREDLLDGDFLAFHVSGGTTEILRCTERRITLLGGTKDISCGKAVDRIGVKLGLHFPAGAMLEKLAMNGTSPVSPKICVDGLDFNLSGVENIADKLIADGEKPENVAAFAFSFVLKTLLRLSENLRKTMPALPIVYAGGVMSSTILQNGLSKLGSVYFARPEYSSDNACGIALLARKEWEKEHG